MQQFLVVAQLMQSVAWRNSIVVTTIAAESTGLVDDGIRRNVVLQYRRTQEAMMA